MKACGMWEGSGIGISEIGRAGMVSRWKGKAGWIFRRFSLVNRERKGRKIGTWLGAFPDSCQKASKGDSFCLGGVFFGKDANFGFPRMPYSLNTYRPCSWRWRLLLKCSDDQRLRNGIKVDIKIFCRVETQSLGLTDFV